MYSPKINEELIPQLYVIAKERKKPMTKLVSQIIAEYLHHGLESPYIVHESAVSYEDKGK